MHEFEKILESISEYGDTGRDNSFGRVIGTTGKIFNYKDACQMVDATYRHGTYSENGVFTCTTYAKDAQGVDQECLSEKKEICQSSPKPLDFFYDLKTDSYIMPTTE